MVLTPRTKDELAHTDVQLPDALKAELAAILQFAGGLRIAQGRIVGRLAQPPLSKDAIAGRLRRLLRMADRQIQRAKISDAS